MRTRSISVALYVFWCTLPLTVAQVYKVTDLGLLQNGTRSRATAINNLGQVTGYADHPDDLSSHAFVWTKRRGMVDLGTFPPDPASPLFFSSWGRGLNDWGQIVGGSWYDIHDNHAALWSPQAGMQDLGKPANFVGSTDASSVNLLGQIVGTAYEGAGGNVGPKHAFFWTKTGGMQFLENLTGGQNSSASAINNFGQIVGSANTATWPPYTTNAFLWTKRGGIVDLGIWTPAAINNLGVIVGFAIVNGRDQAVLWKRNQSLRYLGTLAGGTDSAANAINDFGMVVGWSISGADPFVSHAMLWSAATGMWDLNDLIPANSGWVLYQATGVNEWGEVVGNGTVNGQEHGFLLTPNLTN